MAALSGVILPLHLWGPLSDSAFLFHSGESGNTHLRRLPSCPALPCAAVRRAPGRGTEPGCLSRRCLESVGTAEEALWVPVPAHPKSPKLKCRSRVGFSYVEQLISQGVNGA